MHVLKTYPFKLLAKYPGMRPKDVIIWDNFIQKNPDFFDSVMYDVHLGDPVQDHTTKEDMVASGAYDVSQWCVDVIGRKNMYFFVIEIKPEARASALGQALAYKKLLVAEGRVPEHARTMVLTDEIQPITKRAADLLGVFMYTP